MEIMLALLVSGISFLLVPDLLEVLIALTFMRIEGQNPPNGVKKALLSRSLRISALFLTLLAIFIPMSLIDASLMALPYSIFGIMMVLTLASYWIIDPLAVTRIRSRRSRISRRIIISAGGKEKAIIRSFVTVRKFGMAIVLLSLAYLVFL